MLTSSRHPQRVVNIWPGYVDALSALLMLVIFVLLVFTLAQFFLTEILSGRDKELAELNRRLSEISSLLALEQDEKAKLTASMQQMSDDYSKSIAERYELLGQVGSLTARTQADQERIELQLRKLASLREDIASLQEMRQELESQVGQLALAVTGRNQEAGALRDRSKTLEARLADEAERTLLAQTQITRRDIRIRELAAVMADKDQILSEEKQLSANAQAQVALLNLQIQALREQLTVVGEALRAAEDSNRTKATELADLGRRLNLALAQRVNKLKRYRSEFFGRLREVLGEDPNIRIVGDRFIFQSELLFASGSADLGDAGRQQLGKLAVTLREVAARIPGDINWILRVDGHTDRVPIKTRRFPSNWDLSTARAVSVVRYLAVQGISQDRLSAAGFGEFHPVDTADTRAAFQRNRRIEIKLTDR